MKMELEANSPEAEWLKRQAVGVVEYEQLKDGLVCVYASTRDAKGTLPLATIARNIDAAVTRMCIMMRLHSR